tara:strand:- start:48 stop:848 length:801 start_codon:yes stop_codon:yes gene_type:complete
MPTFSQISLCIQRNKKSNTPKINVNPEYQQRESVPETIKVKPVEEVSIVTHNEIIEIPKYFDFLDKNNYYLYGTANMFDSVLFILSEEFRLGNISKMDGLTKLRDFLLENINSSFIKSKEMYSKKNIKRKPIETYLKELLFSKTIKPNLDVFNLISDTKKINIYILDPDKKIYYNYLSSDSTQNIILVMWEEHILPLMSIHNNSFSDSDMEKILSYFNQKVILNKLTSYKLADLHLLANNNDISITTPENKKKSKQKLYDDLMLLT